MRFSLHKYILWRLADALLMNTNRRCRVEKKKHYENILKILPPKNENFQIKISDIFHISAQNIDSGSNEYSQSMF